jgi:hypothetical protein
VIMIFLSDYKKLLVEPRIFQLCFGIYLETHIYGFMLMRMKTTIELPDELLIAAKKRAADLRKPLKALIEAGLRSQLEGPAKPGAIAARRKIRWVTVDGGLPKELDISSRESMYNWLRKKQ